MNERHLYCIDELSAQIREFRECVSAKIGFTKRTSFFVSLRYNVE